MSQADALIEWLCNDDDMTDAEIAASLAESGIDVDAFCERMKKIRDEGMKRLNDTKLKPCPFCGAEALAVEDGYVTCAAQYCAVWCIRIQKEAWQKRAPKAAADSMRID